MASSRTSTTHRSEKDTRGEAPEKPAERPIRIKPDEVVYLVPRLRDYVTTPYPTWADVVEAADWLRHELGVSRSLWLDAVHTMGREWAAVALGIVSAKPREAILTTPGAYFYGLVRKAKDGDLNLDRTIWGMRTAQGLPRGHRNRQTSKQRPMS